ncbi:type VII secretion protein EccE [Mycobacterium sp. DL592]|uniref:type VII secretion protein EccE n=1 Tax=Mycobacterium sp. DL592 TaxID=2675524 RepID=UPI00141DB593|nr:type VII secretion protein EccE [Mycobacterium sp. DL592]
MSALRSRIALPGPGRITLVALAVIPAVLAYPWRTAHDRWVLGVGVVLAVVLLAWWRGRHLTSVVAGRIALLVRGRRPSTHQPAPLTDARTTVALRLAPGAHDEIPLSLIAGYLDRYGVRADAVRLTSRDTASGRTTWVTLTLSATANLVALQARSADLPLRETAETVLRRLADHLRELGWSVNTTDLDIPDLLGPVPQERWRSVQDGTQGYLTAYGVTVGEDLGSTLAEIRAYPSSEVWTAVQITGTVQRPKLAAAAAIRSEDGSPADLPTLVVQDGRQLAAVTSLHPLSLEGVVAEQVQLSQVPDVGWPTSAVGERAGLG